MGSWGVGIFSNDIALDIKAEYQTLLAFGTPSEKAYQLIKEAFSPEEDGVEFWFAMAEIQCKYGILHPDVKQHALDCIDNGHDEARWEGAEPKILKDREKIRMQLKEKLLADQLPRKKVPKPSVQKPRWQVGDIISSRIVCKTYSEKWFYNKYVLYRVTHLKRSEKSLIIPGLAYDEWVTGDLYNWIGD